MAILAILFDNLLALDFLLRYNNIPIKKNLYFLFFPVVSMLPQLLPVFSSSFSVFQVLVVLTVSLAFLVPQSHVPLTKRIISCGVYWGLLVLINTLVLLFSEKVFELGVENISDAKVAIQIIVTISSKMLLFILTRICLRLGGANLSGLQRHYRIIFILTPICGFIASGVIIRFALAYNLSEFDKTLAVILIFILFIFCMSVYFFGVQASKREAAEAELHLLETKNVFEHSHLSELRQLYGQISGMKHDLINHLQCIGGFLVQGQSSEATEYINKLKEQANVIFEFTHTKHQVLNLLVNTKLSLARERGIEAHAEITETDFSGISDLDLTAMLGNMMDNAIEASLNENNPQIILDIRRYHSYRMFTVQNRVSTKVLDGNPNLVTSKPGNGHGLGVKQIQLVAKKNNGHVNFYQQEDMFYARAILPKTE